METLDLEVVTVKKEIVAKMVGTAETDAMVAIVRADVIEEMRHKNGKGQVNSSEKFTLALHARYN